MVTYNPPNPMAGFRLPAAVENIQPSDNVVRTGTVRRIVGKRIEVDIGGSYVVAGYLGSYVPALGHTVAVIRQDAAWLILGVIQGQGQGNALPPPKHTDLYVDYSGTTVYTAGEAYLSPSVTALSKQSSDTRLDIDVQVTGFGSTGLLVQLKARIFNTTIGAGAYDVTTTLGGLWVSTNPQHYPVRARRILPAFPAGDYKIDIKINVSAGTFTTDANDFLSIVHLEVP